MATVSDTMMVPAFLPGISAATAGLAAFGIGAVLALFWQRRRLAVWPRGPGLLLYGGAAERRAWGRRKGSRVRIQLASGDGTTALGSGWVIDRSTGGLCVQFAEEIRPGTRLRMRPVHATSAMPWVPVEVKSCRARNGGWEIGCRFVRRPAWHVLLLFG